MDFITSPDAKEVIKDGKFEGEFTDVNTGRTFNVIIEEIK